MAGLCHALSAADVQILMRQAVEALCERPNDTPAGKEARSHAMIHCILSLRARDAEEFMVATIIAGQFEVLTDAMRDPLRGQDERVKARTRAGIGREPRPRSTFRNFR